MTRAARHPAVLGRCTGALVAVWSAGFASLHAYWAFGGRAFLGVGPHVDAAFARPAFAVYNGVVAVLCAIGAAAAPLAVEIGLARSVARAARVMAWSACVLLLLRAGVGIDRACSV